MVMIVTMMITTIIIMTMMLIRIMMMITLGMMIHDYLRTGAKLSDVSRMSNF